MLPAQVSFWQLQETGRHNRVSESQEDRKIKETGRHNLATENLTRMDIEEKKRHNIQDESIRWGTLEEVKRNNLYNNRQGDIALGLTAADVETRRFNAVNQASTNLMNAKAALAGASAAGRNAEAAMLNAGTNAAVGASTINLNMTRAEQEQLTGEKQREKIGAETVYTRARTTTEYTSQDFTRAKTEQTRKDTNLADFYATDRAKQTDIQQQREINNQFGKILDNLTPWR